MLVAVRPSGVMSRTCAGEFAFRACSPLTDSEAWCWGVRPQDHACGGPFEAMADVAG